MPPRTNLAVMQDRITRRTPTSSSVVSGVLLDPGLYELRNVLLPGALPTWPSLPITGHIHVAASGANLVESWILFASYTPVGLGPNDAVVIKAVSTGAPPPFNTFLDSVNPGPGTVITTWSYEAPAAMNNVAQEGTQAASARSMKPASPRRGWEQCADGDVEIVGTTNTGGVGAGLGTVAVSGPTGGIWQAGQFVEDWTIFTSTQPMAAGQAALLRPCGPLGTPPAGSSHRLWNVSYQQL